MKQKLKAFLIIIFLCLFCCLTATAQTTPNNPIIKHSFFEKFNRWKHSYKTQLEIQYYEDLLRKNPNDIEVLKTYANFLKNHKYYDKAIIINNRLSKLTKDKKYKTEIELLKSSSAYKKKEDKFLEYINKAKKYESQGNIIKAHEFYLEAQKIFSNRFEVKFGLAKTYGWMHKKDLAFKYYNELLKEAPNNISVLEAYAQYLEENQNYTKAKELYNKLLAKTKNEKYKSNIAEIVMIERGYNPSQDELMKSSGKADPFQNYLMQAQIFESQSKILKANEFYLKAYEKSPNRYEARYGLAKTYGWIGQKELANKFYKELLQEQPNNADLIASYNKFLKESKAPPAQPAQKTTPSEAVAVKQPTPIIKPNPPVDKNFLAYIKQAQSFETQGKTAEANEYYLKAKKIYPDRYEAKFGLAKTYGWLHKNELSLKYYKELLSQSPNNPDLQEAYANYLRDTNDYTKSLEIYKKLFEKNPNDKYKAAIAMLYFIQKDYKTALKLYQEIYTKNPNNPEIQKSLGLVYFVSGDFPKAIEYYKQYIAQKDDQEVSLNLAKSLFYTKAIRPSKEIMETYITKYPNDAEGFSVLADIYLALNSPKKAMELTNRAIAIAPDNIKYQIQAAKIDIIQKNYAQAKNLLCKLLKIEPQNPEIIESLGDISLYTEEFKQAICLYKSIPDFEKNKRLQYKIAQGYHYDKDFGMSDFYYGKLVSDPEYNHKAQIGMAEVQIIQDKPLQARHMLNNILAESPCDIQAQKNLAITYFSTGDNFKSIRILEKLPQNDPDITYNLAKAYNGIERRDVALDLLRDNPQKNAQELKETIIKQIEPGLEPLYNIYHMTGNANAGKWQKGGGTAYLFPRPNIKASGSIITTRYKNVTNIQTTNGTLYTVNLEGRPHDHIGFKTGIGIQDYSTFYNVMVGNALLKIQPNDVVTWTSGYIRSIDEIDSYMSAAGVIPTTGPFANQLVGRIIDNKFVIANIAFKLPKKYYAYIGWNLGNKYGSFSPSNSYVEVPAGFGKVLYSAPEDRTINQALLGYDLYYTAYAKDRSGFGGADLNFSPVGSGPTTSSALLGGYFSPIFFLANKIPITLKGYVKALKLKYFLSAFIGTQTIDGSTGLLPGTGNGTRTNPYYGYNIRFFSNEDKRFGINLDYSYNNYFTIEQHLFRANLIFRF